MPIHLPSRMTARAIIALLLLGPGAACRAEEQAAAPALVSATADAQPLPDDAPGADDAMMLAAAASACQSGDARGFFDAFARSDAVKARYSADEIAFSVRTGDPGYRTISQQRLGPAAYRGRFPIRIEDVYYRSVPPEKAGDTQEYVLLELNHSSTNHISVEWARVHFDGQSGGGDDLGRAYTLDGKPYERGGPAIDGQLLFEPHGDCWRLTADMRQLANEP